MATSEGTKVSFETSADIPFVPHKGADQEILAATVERANQVLKRIALVVASKNVVVEPTWQGPDGNISLEYRSPETVIDSHDFRMGVSRHERHIYTANLQLQQTSYSNRATIGFILRALPYGASPASVMANYRLGEEYSESWAGIDLAGSWSSERPHQSRPLDPRDCVIGAITGPVQLIEGAMIRDFTLASIDPELLRARVETVVDPQFMPSHFSSPEPV